MKHPEQREGEIYLGNATRKQVQESSWRSSRLGVTARDSYGAAILQPDFCDRYFPWFIDRSEVEAAIKAIPVDAPNRDERIRAFQSMLDE